MPTAIEPGRSLWPMRATCSAKKAWGTLTMTPAPSPVLPSASTAPRCQTALSAAMASSTTSRRGLPSMAQTRPTPQASRSEAGS